MAAALDLRIATCVALPEPDVDQAPLSAALAAAGLSAALVGWDDPAADWDGYDVVLVRSVWDADQRRDEFVAWARRVAAGP
ncbi:MAG TPA: hypothetical protein VF516_45210, partial [Kofleriaceae bacterium]